MRPETFTRREFAKQTVIGAVAAPLATSATALDRAEAADAKQESVSSDGRKRIFPEEHLLEVIKQRYADKRLESDILDKIRRKLKDSLGRSKVLSRFLLENSDEPAFVFTAYCEDNQ